MGVVIVFDVFRTETLIPVIISFRKTMSSFLYEGVVTKLARIFLSFVFVFRSAAYIKMGQFHKALQDAVKAKDLNPEWAKVRGEE